MPNFQTVDFSRALRGFHPGGQPDMAALRQATGSETAAGKMALALSDRHKGRRRAALINALTDPDNALAAPIIAGFAEVMTRAGASEQVIAVALGQISKGRISVRFVDGSNGHDYSADGGATISANGSQAEVTLTSASTQTTTHTTTTTTTTTETTSETWTTETTGDVDQDSGGDGSWLDDVSDVLEGAANGATVGAAGGGTVGAVGGGIGGGIMSGPAGAVKGAEGGAAVGGVLGGFFGAVVGGLIVIGGKLFGKDNKDKDPGSGNVMELPDGRGDYRPELGW